MEDPAKTGATLRAMRIAVGLSQKQLAALLGCTRSNVSLIEAGNHWPPLPLFFEWTRLCGCRIGIMAPSLAERLVDVPFEDQERVVDLALALGRLPERQRAAIEGLLLAFSADNNYKRAPEK
jgi:transcriptional regulator with XRE-family HTH domain